MTKEEFKTRFMLWSIENERQKMNLPAEAIFRLVIKEDEEFEELYTNYMEEVNNG